TSGPCVPNTVLYQAELHSGRGARIAAVAPGGKRRCNRPRGRPTDGGPTDAGLFVRTRSATPPPPDAPVAQLDRAPDYESGGWRFESFRARQPLPAHAPLRLVRLGVVSYTPAPGMRP